MPVPNVPPITWRESGAEQPIRGAPASTSATPSTPRLSGSGHVCLIAVPGTGIPLPPGVL